MASESVCSLSFSSFNDSSMILLVGSTIRNLVLFWDLLLPGIVESSCFSLCNTSRSGSSSGPRYSSFPLILVTVSEYSLTFFSSTVCNVFSSSMKVFLSSSGKINNSSSTGSMVFKSSLLNSVSKSS